MNINDHKLLRKLLDDLGTRCAHDRIDYWSLQLDSGMVAEIRFVEPATLPTNMDEPCCESCARKINNDDRWKFDIPRGMTHAVGCAGAECIENGYKCYFPREGVGNATLLELFAKPEIIRCACGVGVIDCASWCLEDGECPKESDGRCCEVCAHYNGGKLTETCEDCSMLSHWKESELTEEELEALTDDDIMPVRCATCKHMYSLVMDCHVNCHDRWEPQE